MKTLRGVTIAFTIAAAVSLFFLREADRPVAGAPPFGCAACGLIYTCVPCASGNGNCFCNQCALPGTNCACVASPNNCISRCGIKTLQCRGD
jgi:hypothetical protein